MKVRKLIKAVQVAVAIVAVGCAVSLAVVLWIYRDIPADVLEDKYGKPPSKFMTLDGVRLHYRDEGNGQPIILIHGHWGSLFQWDSWMPALRPNHRVVRFDLTSHGLTGVDPSGDYTNERAVRLVEQFVDRLDLDQFHVAGTSIGGMVAYKYTALHPERVLSLALINSGGLKVPDRGPDDKLQMPWWIDVLAYYTPKSLIEGLLRNVAGDPDNISPNVVDQWYEMNMRQGQREAEIERNRQFTVGHSIEELNSISAPTLLMWGEANRNLPLSQVGEFKKHLTRAHVSTVTYPGIGHNVTYEHPQESVNDYLQFLKTASTE